MPQSTALPPQQIEFYSDMIYPQVDADLAQGSTLNIALFSKSRPGTNQTPEYFVGGVGGEGGAGTVLDYFVHGQQGCARAVTTVNGFAEGWRADTWAAGYNAGDFNPGAFYDPSSVVAIIDFKVAMQQVAFAGAADVTGFWFSPRDDIFTQPSLRAASPGGSNPQGGFGVALNNDGGGNSQWEFVSYDAVPTILQRTVIGAGFVPDVTDWTTFRFEIIAAASGRAATLSLFVNGAAVTGVQNLAFDDVTLMRPNTLSALAANWFYGHALDAWAGGGSFFRMYSRFGRFTAAGAEIQGI